MFVQFRCPPTLRVLALGCAVLLIGGCTGVPAGVEPVRNFELDRYLGTWFEVARLDHRFERGLSQVTATYSLAEDGSVVVVNRGLEEDTGGFDEAQGRARFQGDTDIGLLEVSFFGPFFGSYIVFELDSEYRYAFVAGPSHDYLWFLSRTPTVSAELMAHFLETAGKAGFNVDELIIVDQDSQGATSALNRGPVQRGTAP